MANEKDTEGTPEVSEGANELMAAEPVAAEIYEKLLAEKQDLYDRVLRKQAELDNFRKRAQKEKEEFRQHANEDLIRSLLPVLDGFERALNHREAGVPDSYYQGLELIYRQMHEALGRVGVAAIEAEGSVFDPHLHQAVETVQAPDRREHEIVEELQRGYKLRSRLLRPAIVRIATGGRSDSSPQGGEDI